MNWLEKIIVIWALADLVLFAVWIAAHGGLKDES